MRQEHGEGSGGGRAGAEFDLAAMEILEPLAEKYGLFLAERTGWHVLFRGDRRMLDVACDPWTCWALGARVGMWSEADSGPPQGAAAATNPPRALSVQDILHSVYGMRENAWPWIAATPQELRTILLTLAGLVDRYCGQLLLDDDAFARAERLISDATAEREAFLRQFEDR
ncbi:conserved hypothetical protein [Frankia canadensis]|uniref:Uncharacterized protein n=1 Tax=Frankia canadensis TaxID=1836972 RepID=A0A2I2KS56_9ACTN|nr:hypothetical protein [Frankia canadensis]SNQ48501.1 conserved hypothetical protein [Frankia canadensis]SOU55791.1 conserved hypothetical protein [Frankia canadensis]